MPGSTSATRRCSANWGARATTSPEASNTAERPSKTSSSWPPTWLQKASAAAQSSARVASIASRRSALPRWNGDAEMQQTRSTRAAARSAATGFGYQMSSQTARPMRRPLTSSTMASSPGAEVARLVEDPVVGQEALAVDGLDAAVGHDRRRVVAVAVPLREADHRDAGPHRGRDPVERLARRGREGGPQQQVLRRVAGDRELRDERDVGAGLGGVGEGRRDQRGVAVDVADDRVQLGQRDADVSGVPRWWVGLLLRADRRGAGVLRPVFPTTRDSVAGPGRGKLTGDNDTPRGRARAPTRRRPSGRVTNGKSATTATSGGRPRRRTRRPYRTDQPEPRGRRGGRAPTQQALLPRRPEGPGHRSPASPASSRSATAASSRRARTAARSCGRTWRSGPRPVPEGEQPGRGARPRPGRRRRPSRRA